MSMLPRIAYPKEQALIGMSVTGAMFFATGAVLFFGLGAVMGAVQSSDSDASRYMSFLWSLPSEWLIACSLGGCAFFAALVVTRSRWSYRTALSCCIAYAAFFLGVLLQVDWSRVLSLNRITDLITLCVPFVAAPAGATMGKRIFGTGSNMR